MTSFWRSPLAIGRRLSQRVLPTGPLGAIPDPSTDFTRHGFIRRTLPTGAGVLTYYEAGQGTPLVFLHGIGGGASAWVWSKVAPAFQHRYRVIVPDLVGWGNSEHPARPLVFEDYVHELEALLIHLGAPATVVTQGQAFGFAAELARTQGFRFLRLLMFTPTGGRDFGIDSFPPAFRVFEPWLRARPLSHWLYRLVFHRAAFIRDYFTRQGFLDPHAVSRATVQATLYSARQPNAAYAALPFLTGELRFDAIPYLRDLKVPASMVWNEDEPLYGPGWTDRLAGVNPLVPLTLFPAAKSTPQLEWPGQTIALIDQLLPHQESTLGVCIVFPNNLDRTQ